DGRAARWAARAAVTAQFIVEKNAGRRVSHRTGAGRENRCLVPEPPIAYPRLDFHAHAHAVAQADSLFANLALRVRDAEHAVGDMPIPQLFAAGDIGGETIGDVVAGVDGVLHQLPGVIPERVIEAHGHRLVAIIRDQDLDLVVAGCGLRESGITRY